MHIVTWDTVWGVDISGLASHCSVHKTCLLISMIRYRCRMLVSCDGVFLKGEAALGCYFIVPLEIFSPTAAQHVRRGIRDLSLQTDGNSLLRSVFSRKKSNMPRLPRKKVLPQFSLLVRVKERYEVLS